MVLDHPELLLGVEVPELDDATIPSAVEEGAVDSNVEDSLVVLLAKTHNLAVFPCFPLGHTIILFVLLDLPHLNGAFCAAGDQNLLVGIHKDGRPLCDGHAIDFARMRAPAGAGAIDLEGLASRWYQFRPLVPPAWCGRSADSDGIEEGINTLVGVVGVVMGYAASGITQLDPLYSGILGADKDCVLLGRVCAREDITDVIEPVDLVETGEGGWTPDGDDGVAAAGNQEGPGGRGGGRRVGRGGLGGRFREREKKPQDVAPVGLEALDQLESGEGPDADLSGLGAGEDVLVANGEGHDRVVMFELLYALGSIEVAILGL